VIYLIKEKFSKYDNNNELPRRKQRGIFKSIERPKGRGIKPKLRNKSNRNAGYMGPTVGMG
jgi:hypothetical protein